ncbi:MAG TPA: cupin domain-containing protein [Conexibacter sp.]|jgi:quercetin dioxygenase-like cupin family protein
MNDEITTGDGYAVGSLDALGSGPGFRKVRGPLGVRAFGINAIVLPEGWDIGRHYHEHQEETYFVHSGEIEFRFGDGSTHLLKAGGIARVDATTVRGLRNVGAGEAVYVCMGGKDGYVERDGVKVNDDGSEQR